MSIIINNLKTKNHSLSFTGRQQSSKIQADSIHAGVLYKDDEILKHFDQSSKIFKDIKKNCFI